MKPFYWQGTTNFGDYLNHWLWPEILGDYLETDGVRLIGIGSLLKSSLNYLEGTKVIFGTGSGYGAVPDKTKFEDWLFYFVRGPLTAGLFDLDPKKSIVDGAWLISQVKKYQVIPEKKGVSFIPHWTTAETGNWRKICEIANIQFINPMDDLDDVLTKIAKSEFVITESLHGAIIADYFRTPWVPVSISPKFLPFKWVDWFQSVGLDAEMYQIPLSDVFEYMYCGQSRRNINYLSSMQPIVSDVIVEEAKEVVIAKPGLVYKSKTLLRGKAKSCRSSLLRGSLHFRDNIVVSDWNNRHQDLVAKMFTEICKGRFFLSMDSVRQQKIEQLSEVTEKLKADYNLNLIK